jgi:isopenicillin-N N-acyltransferase like protein
MKQKHRLSVKLIAGLLGFALGASVWVGCATRAIEPKSLTVATPEPVFPLPVIELRGTPAEIGTQHGQKLNPDIHFLVETYLRPFFKSETQRFIALTAASGFRDKLLPRHQQELDALAASTQLDPREVLLAQCFLDLSKLMACSTIALPAEASPDHVARLGRNLDFPSLDVADKHTVVFVVHPEGKNAFCAVAWPGMMGVLSGMNQHGLTLCNMEVSRAPRLPSAMPYSLLYRTILEDCATVDEAISLLQRTPRQTSNNLMLMDAAGNRAVAEITPEGVNVRRGLPGKALISTNHQRNENQDTPGECWRYDLLHEMSASQFGNVGTKELEAILEKVQQGKMTLQSMVFEPKNQVLYLATGSQAADQQFFELDLKRRWR